MGVGVCGGCGGCVHMCTHTWHREAGSDLVLSTVESSLPGLLKDSHPCDQHVVGDP